MIKALICICLLSAAFALPTSKDRILQVLKDKASKSVIVDDISGAGEDPLIDDISGAGEDPIIDDISGAGEDIIDDISGAGEDPIIDDISGAGEDPIIDDISGAGEDPIIDDISGAGEDTIDDISGAGEDPIIDDISGAGEDIIDDISGAGEDPIIDDISGAGEDPIIDDISGAGEDPIIDDISGAGEDLYFVFKFEMLMEVFVVSDAHSPTAMIDDISGAGEDLFIDDISGAGEDIIDDISGAGEDPIIDDISGAGEDIIDDISGAGEDPIPDGEVAPFFDAWTDVEFQLYTRSNPTTAQILILNNLNSVRNSNFLASRPTRYIIHGWNNNGGSDVNKILRDAYLKKGDFNVICVDWGKGANHPIYTTSRDRIYAVSDVGAAFLDFMANQAGQAISNVQVAGHSLGAHTAGLIGKKVKSGKIPKIAGLDPASVGFELGKPDARLDKSDANYVEVTHTSFLGMSSPIGHVDYYPNWGGGMPGCGTDISGACSHGRAYEYYGESINSAKGFTATRCDSYNEISSKTCTSRGTAKFGGEPLNAATTQGVYFFETNSASPYAK